MLRAAEHTHFVLQLHGGGTLVLSEVIKCAVIEAITGKRIPDLFPSIIADSGGAIVAFGLHFKSAEEILTLFLQELPNVLPNRKFFLSQAFARKKAPFDPTGLKTALENVFGDKTLANIHGNIFIRTHSIDGHAERISKISDGSNAYYTHSDETTSLVEILLKATAIPGVLPSPEGKSIDTLTDQNPLAILIKLSNALPNQAFRYVMVGNIHHDNLSTSFRTNSVIKSYLTGAYQSYAALHRQSAHLEDLTEILAPAQITSLITFSTRRFSSIDNSSQQRTDLTIETLNDIEARADEYTQLAQQLLGDGQPLAMSVDDAIVRIRQQVDQYMVKDKIVSDTPDEIPDQFPSPEVVPTHTTNLYKFGYLAGYFLARSSPALATSMIEKEFNFAAIGRDALQKILLHLLPSSVRLTRRAEEAPPPQQHTL